MTLSPPTARTLYGLEFAQYAGKGLTLLVCDDCDTIIYPHRELRNRCLGDSTNWQNIESVGTVLAGSVLARSFNEWFTERLPWLLVSVHLQGGVSVICHAHLDVKNPENTKANVVYLQVCIDAGGSGVLVAMPEAAANERFTSLDAALNWRPGITQEAR